MSVSGGVATALSPHTLTCAVTGVATGTTVTYTWSRGGATLHGPSTSAQYTISSVGVTDAGDDYLCEVTVTADFLDLTGSISASGRGTLQVQCK